MGSHNPIPKIALDSQALNSRSSNLETKTRAKPQLVIPPRASADLHTRKYSTLPNSSNISSPFQIQERRITWIRSARSKRSTMLLSKAVGL